ncbi:hypothetical protein evm_012999 [Chilo suppressalis]|nr:hypothetical protein evm_012999 [Chilo suppressalis]
MITKFFTCRIELHSIKQNLRTMSHKVFVYGTLKRNEPNHHWLTNRDHGYSKFVSKGVTKAKYPLIIATKYNIPFLLYSPGNGFNVKGEIYEVCDDMLKNLDILEDHPSYYVRELDDIRVIKEGTDEVMEMKCWVYYLKRFKSELLNRPFLENYSSKGGHGLPYMESNNESTIEDVNDVFPKD